MNYTNMDRYMNGFQMNYDVNNSEQDNVFDNEFPVAMEAANMNVSNNLSQKLAKQAGDNMNFNKCNFDGQTNPNDMYDAYNGFIRGNMFPNLYNQYKINRPYDVRPLNNQAKALTMVDAYSFAAHDVNLYLDTHPNDRQMINLFKEYTDDMLKAIREYENKFGPLFVDSSVTYPWAWNNSPWPWENK